MRMHITLFLSLLLSVTAQAQQSTDDEKIATLLSGRKNPGDQALIASLGIGSLDSLLARLKDEQDQNKVPIYCRLIGIKYRQFSEQLTLEKRSGIVTPLSAKITAIRDEGQTAYLIHSSLEHLHGINHPAVLQLIEVYSKSGVDWTRKAAQSLKSSLTGTALEPEEHRSPFETTPAPKPPPLVQPTTPKTPEAKPPSEEPTSSTPWSIIVVLIVAAIGLLWLLLKGRK